MRIGIILLTLLAVIFYGCGNMHDKLEKRLEDITAPEFNGLIYTSLDETVFFNKSFSTIEKQIATPKADTPISLASLTKLFTKMVTLKLAEMGELNLDSTITAYIKDFKPAFGKEVTIRHLLKMQSGLPRELSESGKMPIVEYDSNGNASSFLKAIQDYELKFEPGTQESYSNLNYWLLGMVIETVSNKNIDAAFHNYLFKPLGMINSGLFIEEKNVIPGYIFVNDRLTVDTTDYKMRYTSGGCYSSLNDLLKFAKAINQRRYLSAEYQKLLYRSGSQKVEVYGSLPGFTNMFICEPEHGFILIVLNNLGLRNLETMTNIKASVEKILDINSRTSSPKRKVKLDPIASLDSSAALEKGVKEWIEAIEMGDKEMIFTVLNNYSPNNSFEYEDKTWSEIIKIKNDYPNFRAAGFRWVKNEFPAGIEVWFITDESAKIAFLWIQSEADPNKIDGFMVKPDDMEWMGESF